MSILGSFTLHKFCYIKKTGVKRKLVLTSWMLMKLQKSKVLSSLNVTDATFFLVENTTSGWWNLILRIRNSIPTAFDFSFIERQHIYA